MTPTKGLKSAKGNTSSAVRVISTSSHSPFITTRIICVPWPDLNTGFVPSWMADDGFIPLEVIVRSSMHRRKSTKDQKRINGNSGIMMTPVSRFFLSRLNVNWVIRLLPFYFLPPEESAYLALYSGPFGTRLLDLVCCLFNSESRICPFQLATKRAEGHPTQPFD